MPLRGVPDDDATTRRVARTPGGNRPTLHERFSAAKESAVRSAEQRVRQKTVAKVPSKASPTLSPKKGTAAAAATISNTATGKSRQGRRGRRRKSKTRAAPKSVAELNMEIDGYMKTGAAPTSAS